MYLYIELWKAKEAWLKLTPEQRKARIDELLAEAKKHPITGVVPFSFKAVGDVFLFDGITEQPVVIDKAVARPTGFKYAAAWMIPTRELIAKFEQRVENLDWWWDYFEQENAWGAMDVQATVAAMINEGSPAPSQRQPTTFMGKLLQTDQQVQQLAKDVSELKHGMSVVVDFVNQQNSRRSP